MSDEFSSSSSSSSDGHEVKKNQSQHRKLLQHKTTKRQENYYPQWHNLVSGGVAGAGSRLLTAPLDLLRIRLQLETTVVEYPRPGIIKSLQKIAQLEGGYRALFRGSVAATYLWIGYSAVQFALYGRVQHWFLEEYDEYSSDPPDPTLVAFISGATAGVFATVATYPFDICRTIFAARGLSSSTTTTSSNAIKTAVSTVTSTTTGSIAPPKSLFEFALVMHKQRGIRAFYAGCSPAVMQVIPYMGLNFALYDIMTRGDKRSSTSSVAGMISGATSKVIVYPLDTVKKRLQAQSAFGTTASSTQYFHRPYTGMVDCIVTMARTEGAVSFYRGLLPSVLKSSLSTGLTFGLFRLTKNALESIHDAVTSPNHHETNRTGGRRRSTREEKEQPLA